MGLEYVVDRGYGVRHLTNFGRSGVNLFSHEDKLLGTELRALEQGRLTSRAMERRAGAEKIVALDDDSLTNGSMSAFSNTAYGIVTNNPQLTTFPVGGFALKVHFTADRRGSPPSNTAMVIHGKAKLPATEDTFLVQYSNADGVILSTFTRSDTGLPVTCVCSAVADGATVHLLSVYDPVAGTWTTYINGVLDAQVTGLPAGLQPYQGVDQYFMIGASSDSAGGAVADHWPSGSIDSVTFFAFGGVELGDGSRSTLLGTLLRWQLQDWPAPMHPMVRCHYGCDEASGATMVDSSRWQTHGTWAGSPTSAANVAKATNLGHALGRIQRPDGSIDNFMAAGGQMFTSEVTPAVT